MEDLGARLEQLLSDPQALSQIGELAASLGPVSYTHLRAHET